MAINGVQLVLHADNAALGRCSQDLHCTDELLGAVVADPDVFNNAALTHCVEVLHLLFETKARVGAVVLPEVEFRNSEASGRCFCRAKQIIGARVAAPNLARLAGDAGFGADHDFCLLLCRTRPGAHGICNHKLVLAEGVPGRRIDVGGVEERNALIHGGVQSIQYLLVCLV